MSYVLSGKRPVPEETRERVAQSIELLGYQPHAGRLIRPQAGAAEFTVLPARKPWAADARSGASG